MVATGPRPLSNLDSTTIPFAGVFIGAFNSKISACNKIASKSSSIPWPVLADNSKNIESPPSSSGITSCVMSSFLTFSGLASGLSILLIATINGVLAAFE